MGWIVRVLLMASGGVAAWFVSKDAPNFGVVQGMTAIVLIALVVAVLAFWPSRWTQLLDRPDKPN